MQRLAMWPSWPTDLGLIRLGDLVEVRRDLEDPANQPVFQDGAPAIILSVEMKVLIRLAKRREGYKGQKE